MKVVLIPGLVGTGLLFDPFIAQAPAGIEVIRLPLGQSPDYGYEDHARQIMGITGGEPFVLVAESYSGMIAYQMLKMGCSNTKHIIFCCQLHLPSIFVS
jgi:pimeloyl-ACP methyl ester carboxylesterase